MNEMILIKLGEIVLKGLNRRNFEAALMKTLKYRLADVGRFSMKIAQSTIYILPEDDEADLDEAADLVGKTFGIVAYSRAAMTEKTLKDVQETAAEYLMEELSRAKTFKVETKRSDKKFPLKSPEISTEVGGYLLEQFPHLTVNVHEPDVIVHVEIRDFAAFVHGSALPGAGGIPVGTGGNAAILISGGLDSPVAAWMMAKRGVELVAVHFASPPYTSPRAEEKVHRLLRQVSRYSGRMRLYTVHFTEIQEQIRDSCPEELFTILMRRFMMRIAEGIAKREDCGALITGESLGQVASQTMQAIGCTDIVTELPVFRPLIGMDKTEIVSIARKIDTFDISIEPFEDCCTVFTPKHPRTRPDLRYVEEAERAMDVEGLIRPCIEETRYCRISCTED